MISGIRQMAADPSGSLLGLAGFDNTEPSRRAPQGRRRVVEQPQLLFRQGIWRGMSPLRVRLDRGGPNYNVVRFAFQHGAWEEERPR